jgi:flagellar hook-basal body complex protein FliE
VATISALSGVSAALPTRVSGVEGLTGAAGTPAARGSDPAGFASALAGGLEEVQRLQGVSSDLAVKAATGELEDVHDYTIAATEAAVATELAVALRNKAIEAFTEIMRMQA